MKDVTLVLAVLAMFAVSVQATPISEEFDYTATELNNCSGSAERGYAAGSEWNTQNGDNAISLGTGSLAYPAGVSFTAAGKMIADAEDSADQGKVVRYMSSPVSLGADGTHYFSGLFRIDDGDTGDDLHAGSIKAHFGQVSFGMGSIGSGALTLCVRIGNTRNYATAVSGVTYFMVVKLETSSAGYDFVSVRHYVVGTDTVPDEEPTTWTYTDAYNGSGCCLVWKAWIITGPSEAGCTCMRYADGLHSGDSWGSVIPEPTTMVLLGIGGIGAMIRRRRGNRKTG